MVRQYAMVHSAGGDAFRQAQHGKAAEVCESVVNAVRNHARGQRQADDLTLIAARTISAPVERKSTID